MEYGAIQVQRPDNGCAFPKVTAMSTMGLWTDIWNSLDFGIFVWRHLAFLQPQVTRDDRSISNPKLNDVTNNFHELKTH